MFFGSVEKPPRLSEFELEIPEKLIAQDPLKKRDECKLMVLNRQEQTIEHRKFKDVLDSIKTGKNMDSKFYSKEKSIAWLEEIGETELEARFNKLQGIKPPSGAPPRTDMPVIDADKDQVKLVSDLLVTGKIDINKPYAKERKK